MRMTRTEGEVGYHGDDDYPKEEFDESPETQAGPPRVRTAVLSSGIWLC